MRQQRAELLLALRFIAVGASATATHMLTASLLYAVLGQRYLLLVNFLAWLVAFGVSFWGHQRVTFKRSTTLGRFLVLSLAGLVINYTCLGLLLWTPLPSLAAMLCAIGTAAVASYWLARQHTFAVTAKGG